MTDKIDEELESARELSPREQVITNDWERIREIAADGLPTRKHIEEIEAKIAHYRAELNSADAETALDIRLAVIVHNYAHSAHESEQRHLKKLVDYLRQLSDSSLHASERYNEFVVRTLVYSNGAVLLGSLAYLGSPNSDPKTLAAALPWVLLTAACGFALGLLSAYSLSKSNGLTARHLMSGAWDHLPQKTIYQAFNEPFADSSPAKFLRWEIRPERLRYITYRRTGSIAGWGSFACLVMCGLLFGWQMA